MTTTTCLPLSTHIFYIHQLKKFYLITSLPSQSHPLMKSVEDHLCRLKSTESTSTSASSICANLASLRELHEGINNLIQMPSYQQVFSNEDWINELVEGSLGLVDLCSLSRDVVYLTKESVQYLQSSMRRNKAETVSADDINAYVASRKKINKMVNKCLKNLKSFNQKTTEIPDRDGDDVKAIGTMLKETESLDLSILNSVLILLSGEKERSNKRSWSFLSKITQTSRVYSEAEQGSGAQDLYSLNTIKSPKSMDSITMKNILKQSEMMIQELEESLESLYRSVVKSRVSLLNLLSH